ARAALPGLVGEMATDPSLHSALLERFADVIAGGLAEWLTSAAAGGRVRADVSAEELAEAIAGITLLGLLTRPTGLDEAWVDRTTQLLLRGIGT
ncbi:MAG: hypothetical protein QOC58_1341, partial [Mycobacterium sp.]|nr:hypothetical protein [Mycobacterium sp.]